MVLDQRGQAKVSVSQAFMSRIVACERNVNLFRKQILLWFIQSHLCRIERVFLLKAFSVAHMYLTTIYKTIYIYAGSNINETSSVEVQLIS